MTSESSSAVLELNDADTEDTEGTVTESTHEGIPPIMEPGYDIAVKVDAPMKQLSTLETYVTYRVRCVCARWPTPPHVRRRYNHFKLLHKRLASSHPLLAPPPMPPLHSPRQQLDRYSQSFVSVRTYALNAFLERVAKHPILTHSEDLRIFLTTPDDELEKVFKSENSALNLWGLSNALYGSGENRNTNGPRVKDPEFTAATDYLHSLQQKLMSLSDLIIKQHKNTDLLGHQFLGLKRACDAWSSQARGRTARGVAACATGAGAAHVACARAKPPLIHSAVLPLLAQYAQSHIEKIKQRDAIHAAYVSGANNPNQIHNRLEQASEALRSELCDWIPKTQAEIKSLLLDLADRQVNIYTQMLLGWEHALKQATETDIFKTVSKSAVQNLSPSKCKVDMSPTETERDLDDYSDYNDDLESHESDQIRNLNNDSNNEKTDDKHVDIKSDKNDYDILQKINVGNVQEVNDDNLQEVNEDKSHKFDDDSQKVDNDNIQKVYHEEFEKGNADKLQQDNDGKLQEVIDDKFNKFDEDELQKVEYDNLQKVNHEEFEFEMVNIDKLEQVSCSNLQNINDDKLHKFNDDELQKDEYDNLDNVNHEEFEFEMVTDDKLEQVNDDNLQKVNYDKLQNLDSNDDNNIAEVSEINKTENDVLSEILKEDLPSNSETKDVGEIITDPLTRFTDVNLS